MHPSYCLRWRQGRSVARFSGQRRGIVKPSKRVEPSFHLATAKSTYLKARKTEDVVSGQHSSETAATELWGIVHPHVVPIKAFFPY